MIELSLSSLGILFAAAILAGFVDAIAGGGGIITVPALLAVGFPPHLALGTNKLQASFGSLTAALNYIRSVTLVQAAGNGVGMKNIEGAWWSRSFGNKLGAYMGSLIGILAGTVGWIGGKGKARGFVMAFFWSLLVFGICSLTAGVVALIFRQPRKMLIWSIGCR